MITEKFLRLGATNGMAWKNKQIDILGVEKKKGWMQEVIGKWISDEDASRFLKYRGKKNNKIASQELIDIMIKLLESEGYIISKGEDHIQ